MILENKNKVYKHSHLCVNRRKEDIMLRSDRYNKITQVKNAIMDSGVWGLESAHPEAINALIRELSKTDVNLAIATFTVFTLGTWEYADRGELYNFHLPATKDCCELWSYCTRLFRKGKSVPYSTMDMWY